MIRLARLFAAFILGVLLAGSAAAQDDATQRLQERAVESYNGAMASLESRVMVSARKFADLKTAPLGVEIAELEPVEKSVRAVPGAE